MSFGSARGLSSETTKGGQPLVAPDHPPNVVHLVVGGTINSTDLPALCDRVRAELADGEPGLVVLDVGALANPDLGTVDVLARAGLAARRGGCELRLADACTELRDLLDLAGLADVVPCGPDSGLEAEGKAERREEALGVEEEGDPADPPA
jgi:ABC-type transporter Mla MlaB component